MQKLWNIKPRNEQNLIDQLLVNRGISSAQKEKFLNPKYEDALSPFLFMEMQKAVSGLWEAIRDGKSILIYSDYDADAITANAVLYRALKLLGARVSTYIPDRFSEGYGLNLDAFKKIKEQGVDVVVTVDCGTNSTEEAKFCRENGITLIITDHHEITGSIPDAFALINPKRPGETFPYHELVGVGVSFKVVCALFAESRARAMRGEILPDSETLPEGFEKWFLDLVAIGTVADCHSLLGENRILVKFGLQVLGKSKWAGVRALMQAAALDPDRMLDTYVIGFILAPRVNAAGRIEHASLAFDLLVCDDEARARELAQELDKLNTRRQMLTETVMSEARAQLILTPDHKILMAVGNDWPKGVVGLVAGRLVEEFSRPVLVLERGEEFATGSARSIHGFNILDAISSCRELLERFGGHAAAAGFTLRCDNLEAFQNHLVKYGAENITDADMAKVLEIDAELTSAEASIEIAFELEKFEPFGVDNFKPKFVLRDMEVRELAAVGKEQKHLQMTVVADARGTSPKFYKCIAFGFGSALQHLKIGDTIDIAFEMMVDRWNGSQRLKLRLIDYQRDQRGPTSAPNFRQIN